MTATIALVDDDRNILTSVSIALQTEGFVTRVYSDGETALKALTDNPPDLAIFDIKMPRMDGLELLRRLREKSQIPVIFLTSKDDELDEALGLAMGADDYIAKPFSQRLLIARIRAILRRTELTQSPGTETEAEAAGPLDRLMGAPDTPGVVTGGTFGPSGNDYYGDMRLRRSASGPRATRYARVKPRHTKVDKAFPKS